MDCGKLAILAVLVNLPLEHGDRWPPDTNYFQEAIDNLRCCCFSHNPMQVGLSSGE